jgi:hypothetical protein
MFSFSRGGADGAGRAASAPLARFCRNAMPAGHNVKGRSKSGPPFFQVYFYIMQSPAWASLSTSARSVYLVLGSRFNGSNNGTIGLSARDAADLANINKDTACRALKALVDRGFIEACSVGAFSLKLRHSSEWAFTHLTNDLTGAKPTKAFMKWQPPKEKAGPKRGQSRSPQCGQLEANAA